MSTSATELLLDTHVWIWLAFDDPKLTGSARRDISEAASSSSVVVPAVAVWEIAMLSSRRRLELDLPVGEWVGKALSGGQVRLAELTTEIMIEAYDLPAPFHGDPADRLIVATARLRGATLLTRDRRILAYGALGHVRVNPA
ncbi:MAG: type II toxin-antitoxin system VapC family toxin [Alphaproteobacteria bacterium]|nr:type II toxin-antitoxin system VapC family toxin [Alphaproteobacteria bacterium]